MVKSFPRRSLVPAHADRSSTLPGLGLNALPGGLELTPPRDHHRGALPRKVVVGSLRVGHGGLSLLALPDAVSQ